MSVKLQLSLPREAAERLVKLLNSDTPEGRQARIDLHVESVNWWTIEEDKSLDD